jgi:uncharacterized repeat protein (TIGR03803 family)
MRVFDSLGILSAQPMAARQKVARMKKLSFFQSARFALAAIVILACLHAPTAPAQPVPSFPIGLLYSCNTNSGPSSPMSGFTTGRDGNLYGVSQYGGSNGFATGFGEVFMMTPAGVVTTLYSFTNGSDGANPVGTLIQSLDGSFYGSSSAGSSNNAGAIFNITTNGTFTVVHILSADEGSGILGGLVQASDRTFYGVASSGGSSNYGTIFGITTNGVLTVLHSFAYQDGADP